MGPIHWTTFATRSFPIHRKNLLGLLQSHSNGLRPLQWVPGPPSQYQKYTLDGDISSSSADAQNVQFIQPTSHKCPPYFNAGHLMILSAVRTAQVQLSSLRHLTHLGFVLVPQLLANHSPATRPSSLFNVTTINLALFVGPKKALALYIFFRQPFVLNFHFVPFTFIVFQCGNTSSTYPYTFLLALFRRFKSNQIFLCLCTLWSAVFCPIVVNKCFPNISPTAVSFLTSLEEHLIFIPNSLSKLTCSPSLGRKQPTSSNV